MLKLIKISEVLLYVEYEALYYLYWTSLDKLKIHKKLKKFCACLKVNRPEAY